MGGVNTNFKFFSGYINGSRNLNILIFLNPSPYDLMDMIYFGLCIYLPPVN